jgi:hypothetical protein
MGGHHQVARVVRDAAVLAEALATAYVGGGGPD